MHRLRGQGLWGTARLHLLVDPHHRRCETHCVRGAHLKHPPLRRRELVGHRSNAAAFARLPRAVLAWHVPRVAQAHMGAPHLDGGARAAAGCRLNRHVPPSPAAPLAGSHAPHGLCAAAAAAAAVIMGSAPAPARCASDDIWPQHRARARRLPLRPLRLAQSRSGSGGVARDAAPRAPTGLAAPAADATSGASAADASCGHRHQRQHRQDATRFAHASPAVACATRTPSARPAHMQIDRATIPEPRTR
mmetsp:Transcript_32691/g.89472  ORF Transcript_32691/g.89472 Transcript_32691/m.89472 type:complete len:248 (+) Transcript_32691:173-916(+)